MTETELENIRHLYKHFHEKPKNWKDVPLEGGGMLSDWTTQPPNAKQLRLLIETELQKSIRRPTVENIEFFHVATEFFFAQGDYKKTYEVAKRWAEVDKKSDKPFLFLANLFDVPNLTAETSWLSYEECLECLRKAYQRNPTKTDAIEIAYHVSYCEGDNPRRLARAEELADRIGSCRWYYTAGVEQGRNKLYERAEASFLLGLKQEPNNFDCLLGLAFSFLRRLDLSTAETYFLRAKKIKNTRVLQQQLEIIEKLRSGKTWSDQEKKQRKLWLEWHEKRLGEIISEKDLKQKIAALLVK